MWRLRFKTQRRRHAPILPTAHQAARIALSWPRFAMMVRRGGNKASAVRDAYEPPRSGRVTKPPVRHPIEWPSVAHKATWVAAGAIIGLGAVAGLCVCTGGLLAVPVIGLAVALVRVSHFLSAGPLGSKGARRNAGPQATACLARRLCLLPLRFGRDGLLQKRRSARILRAR